MMVYWWEALIRVKTAVRWGTNIKGNTMALLSSFELVEGIAHPQMGQTDHQDLGAQ